MKIVSIRQEVDTLNEVDLLRVCQGHANIVKLHELFSDEVNFVDQQFVFHAKTLIHCTVA